MKRRNNRFLAGTLAGLMMLTMLPVTALAAEEGTEGNAAVETEGGSYEQRNNEDNIFNVVNDFDTQEADAGVGESNPVGGENGAGESNPTGGENGTGESNPTGGENGTGEGNPTGGENGTGEGNPTGGETSDPVTPPAETFTAKIDGTEYETLDAAINAAQDGATIEIGENCTLTVGTIEKAVVINGNGHTISVPEQDTENHALNINASLTFNKANVIVTNHNESLEAQSIVLNHNGVWTLDKGSSCVVNDRCIYAYPNTVINVKGASKLTVQNITYTAMMGEPFATLNIEDGSEVVIDNADHQGKKPQANGITSFKINVTNATLNVRNCENQGLVNCELTLDKSQSEICNNDMGITGWSGTDVLTMKNGSNLMIKDNAHSGIYMSGGKVDVQDGTTLTITGTGNSVDEDIVEGSYVGALAISTANPANATVKFADNATVNLVDNAVSAIRNRGTIDIGASTVIKNNGSKTDYGGGVRNYGVITVSPKAQLYNNHALLAGDDIYNGTYKSSVGKITFSPVGENWVLDDCKDPIVGWYQDGSEMLTDTARKRWNGDAADENYYADEYTVGKEAVSDALALKAAHGKFCNVTYKVTGDIPSDAGNPPASAKVKMGGSYTVAPAQTTSQSRYTFSGWRINGTGDIVTSLENLQQDVKLVGVWSYRSGGGSGGGGGRKPTVDIPDDVPTGLNGDDHFAYIVGYPDGNVKPGGNITRAEVATIFFRLLTEDVRTANSTQANSLSDVSRGQWFNHAISTLSSMGIVKGNPDGTFDPDAPITRAEFAAIAARFDDKNTNTTSNFSDIASHWAKDEIGVAANKGWINGYPDSTFRPDQYITRAEAMTLVNRVLNRLPEKSEDLLDDMIKWPDNADASVWYYLAVQEATNSHDYSDKSDADKYEKWTKLRDARDWTLLEK